MVDHLITLSNALKQLGFHKEAQQIEVKVDPMELAVALGLMPAHILSIEDMEEEEEEYKEEEQQEDDSLTELLKALQEQE